jgi:hypothetical protein
MATLLPHNRTRMLQTSLVHFSEKTRLPAGFFLPDTLDPILEKIYSGGYY